MTEPRFNEGYFRQPTLRGDQVAFVCEDALWTASITDGAARRLTAWPGAVNHPRFSPDGRWLAFTATREGVANVWCIPAAGGEARRLTWHNCPTSVVGWTPDSRAVLFRSSLASPTPRETRIFSVSLRSGEIRELPVGPAVTLALHPDGRRAVIGRNALDPACWKRYRGGTCGVLWAGDLRRREFRKLLDLRGNVVSPMWVRDRVFFLSDHEDHGNIYSCAPDGLGLRRHTDHSDFYVRFPSTDGRDIVYQKGAELWLCRPDRGTDRPLRLRIGTTKSGLSRKFVPASSYLMESRIHPKGESLLVTSRGKLFGLSNWEGAVRQLGARQGVRYRLARWLHDGKRVVVLSDESGSEVLELWDAASGERLKSLEIPDLGYPLELCPSPDADRVAVADERCRLSLIDLKTGGIEQLDRSEVAEITDLAWSADGRYLAYSKPERLAGDFALGSAIWVHDTKGGKRHDVTGSEFHNRCPSFDPAGKYLAFLSYRTLNPRIDPLELNSCFPQVVKPYLLTLKASEYSPLFPMPKKEEPKPKKEKGKDKKDEADKPVPVDIEFAGIPGRISEFPIREGDYCDLAAVKGKLLLMSEPQSGMLDQHWLASPKPRAVLECYDFAHRKLESLVTGLSEFQVSANGEKVLLRHDRRLRVIKAGEKPPNLENGADAPGPESGWLDLGRIRLEIEPRAEWAQIYLQAWRDQRDFFWTQDLSGIDWPAVRDRYRRLLPKLATRSELSDLIWDMQGELGTSHAYELGGDYAPTPYYQIGLLGADLKLDEGSGRYRISRIYPGDPWKKGHGSPLLASGVNAQEGEYLLAVDGRDLKAPEQPNALLANRVESQVVLRLGPKPEAEGSREVTVCTLADEAPARYREWVRTNRALVHKRSGGRLGYLHVPDMSGDGLVEFHRGLYLESGRDGLIVDIRFNGGGFVSGILISKLARRPIGHFRRRVGATGTYPEHAVPGPIVALCDERSGSDGDIFSQAFKSLKLGPLVGKRTWGGVIGINTRRRFVDQGLATQPEYAYWFRDRGWDVENHGVDPDVEVEWDPASFVAGKDPQLERGVEIALEKLKGLPDLRPSLAPSPHKAPRPLPKRRK
ncbi:MAG: hypothetical protein A2X36_07985 [Elusimicrobia bacterium GWA2_69_24]|nr:MAG: hypothetical protein A2X36_07985 [Elusimicrobia bacterium GWA2_69_24]HBL16545.1 peptidase [Elusimicrobiota bacterium]